MPIEPEHAKEFIKRYPNAKSFVKPSHLDELSPLLEVAIEAIICRKDEFHLLGGNTYMPRKETVDRFALAAGISYNPLEEATRKEGDCYIGRSQAMVMGPDGKYSFGDICEYEFDVEVRHEEEVIADRTSKYPKFHGGGKLLEDKARLAYLALRKVARQRANTGARSRATLSLLGMQTGFKDLFRADAPSDASVTYLFSRIIVNTKNEMVLGYMLSNIASPAAMLYGPSAPKEAIPMIAPPSEPGVSDTSCVEEALDEDPPFILPEEPSDPTRSEVMTKSIEEYLDANTLGPKAQAAARDALENHRNDDVYLADILARLKVVHDRTVASRSEAA